MKTLISIIVIGMISFLSFAQEPNKSSPVIELDDVVITSINGAYLATVQDEYIPRDVALLQQEVANYDVRSAPDFSEAVTTDTFEMVFRNSKGTIDAFYDNRGKIEAAYERFRDVLLPKPVQHELYQSNEGWTMTGNLYASAYEDGDLINRSYRIKLEKGDNMKSVVIHIPN